MADSNEPKKETVRITVTPQPDSPATAPPPRDTVRIHLPTRPPGSQTGPIESPSPVRSAAAAMPAPIDQIPMPLCWALLGVSAAILILQIWNYLS